MEKIELAPYIFFKGNAREAFEFYKSVFGGELYLQTNDQVPKNVQEQVGVNDQNRNQIMHAKLEGGAVTLLGSDTSGASPEAKKISLCLGGADEEKLRKIFDDLCVGGKIFQPLTKMFWGDFFGSFTDKFGVEWMVNIQASK